MRSTITWSTLYGSVLYGPFKWIKFIWISFIEIGSKILSISIIRLDKINDVFDSFQYFWQDCDIFEGQLINESVLETFHRDHES